MRATQIETVVAGRALLGEGPVWDAGTQTLVWVDILRCEVHRYDTATATDRSVRLLVVVGAARPCADGALVVAAGRGVARYDEADGSLDWLGRTAVGDRVNDGTCDPAGRFWVGTLTVGGAGAALYRLDGRDISTEVLPHIGPLVPTSRLARQSRSRDLGETSPCSRSIRAIDVERLHYARTLRMLVIIGQA